MAAKLNAHDRRTRGHTERVRAYSVMIGEEMGLGEHDLELLNWSGLVHDIGKLTVPTEILNKPGKPTDEEWKILRDHPKNADRLVEPLRPWLGQWAESATEHHERYDGKGYPKGIAGKNITLAGRIVAVADAYDVMTSSRSYKKPMPTEEARAELARCAGTQFDPDVVRAFLTVSIGRLRLIAGPLGSLVQLPAGGATLGTGVATGASAAASVAVAAATGIVGTTPPPPQPIPQGLGRTVVEAPPNIEVSGPEDVVLGADLTAIVSADGKTVTLQNGTEHGEVSVSDDGVVTLTPNANFHGIVVIGYEACDDAGECEEGTLTFNVEPVNDPPDGRDDVLVLAEGTSGSIDVVANDVDVDDDNASLRVTSAEIIPSRDHDLTPSGLDSDGRLISLTAPDNASGSMLIRYTVVDQAGESSTAMLVVNVTATNDTPRAIDDNFIVTEATVTRLDVTANDTDGDGDNLTLEAVTGVTGGTATIDGGAVVFTPTPRFTGAGGFRYQVADGNGGTSSAAVTIDIVDDPLRPVVLADVVTLNEDSSATVDVLSNDTSEGSRVVGGQITIINTPDRGSATIEGASTNDPMIRYVPNANFAGTDSLEYRVCDDAGFCGEGRVSLTVAAVNDAPSFSPGPAVTVNDADGAQRIDGWATAISAGPSNESSQSVTFVVSAADTELFEVQPAIDANGALTFTPASDADGVSDVTVRAVDSGGTANTGTESSATATFTITVRHVNVAPSFTPGANVFVAEDSGTTTIENWATAMSAGAPSEAGRSLDFRVEVTNSALFTTLPTISPTGTLTFAVAPDTFGSSDVTIALSDSGGTEFGGTNTSASVTFTVSATAVNDAPSFVPGAAISVTEDSGPRSVSAWATSISPGPANEAAQTVSFTVAAANPSLFSTQPAISPTGTLTFTPAPNANGSTTLSIVLSDSGDSGANNATAASPRLANLTITATNDAPVANNEPVIGAGNDPGSGYTTTEDTPFTTANITTNDTDIDNPIDPTSITIVDAPTNGTLVNNNDGTFTYTPNNNHNGTDTFNYTITDPNGATSNTATVTLTITPVNDAPSFTPGDDVGPVSATDGAQSIPNWATDIEPGPADEEAQSVTFVVSNNNNDLFAAQPALSPTGALTYTAAADEAGTATVSVTLRDDGGTTNGGVDASETIQFTITVAGGSEDFDAVASSVDNCPTVFNIVQIDTDGDGTGDACDASPTAPTTGSFASRQTLAGQNSYGVATGDFDGDGDLDLIFANLGQHNEVWLNNGTGLLNSGQFLGNEDTLDVGVGDLDGDGDLDLIFANDGEPNTVYLNNGSGTFSNSGQALGTADSGAVGLGDFDGDGDLDAIFANRNGSNRVWTNNGSGVFSLGQAVPAGASHSLAVGDFDGDGDLDMVVAEDADDDTVWFNNGAGVMTDSGVTIGLGHSRAVDVGDVDGDGDIDIVFGDHDDANSVWLNNGTGTFTRTAQNLGSAATEGIVLADLDGDGDLGIVTANSGDDNRVWGNS